MPTELVNDIVSRLARRKPVRPEAETQADIYMLLTTAALGLESGDVAKLESPMADGTRRRIDIEAGHVVIEVKKDLRAGNLADYEQQLAGYVKQRQSELGSRYVGILTDGTTWRLYNLVDGALVNVSELALSPSSPAVDDLLIWLESIMATRDKIKPTPEEIEARLGAESPGHRLDHASLSALFEANLDHSEVKLKRNLWAKLLRTAFGKGFTDDPSLFINHTLLVVTAELIAHAAIGWDVSPSGGLTPMQLTSGSEFQKSQIHGVVEADFFDWVVQVEGGEEFVAELGRRIARFDWSQVEHDVLKILYESVIESTERKRLGEYYTPDWLADRVVQETVTDPLNSRVADPSCGSGTFLFHSIRRYLAAADDAGVKSVDSVAQVTSQVIGMDVHPVAVTLARVTYLLAIGLDRLRQPKRKALSVPVYLGDSMQWEQARDLIGGADRVTISTEGDSLVEGGGGVLFGDDLVFPRSILGDASNFDQLVSAMADKALDLSNTKNGTLIDPVLNKFGMTGGDAALLRETFATMRMLHKSGKNHIWGYYVRNLIRPLWLAEPDNRVDILVGNPPWLRYSKMPKAMQDNYKKLAKPRNLLTGGLGASSRDLSTLFVVRAVELYLRSGGKFSFVMPQGILTRKPHTGFRSGAWMTKKSEPLAVRFDATWDFANAATATGFPALASVIFGTRQAEAVSTTENTLRWSGRLKRADVPWSEAKLRLTAAPGTVAVLDAGADVPESPYKKLFRQGAILVPRMLMFVEELPAGPLGTGAGRAAVVSQRTNQDDDRWKQLPSITSTVDPQYIRNVYLGETLLPFRTITPRKAVVPINESSTALLTAAEIKNRLDLDSWWAQAETAWEGNRSESDEGSFLDRINYIRQLQAQLPIAPLRVVYPKAGNTLPAGIVRDAEAVIDHKLYWMPVATESEGHYLCSVLNSQATLEAVKPLQALGLLKGRDWDKNVFAFPFPRYDPANPIHQQLSDLGAQAEVAAAAVDVTSAKSFQAKRKRVAEAISKAGISQKIEVLVNQLQLVQ